MSEFRQDPVSGDWVIIAPKRALRPDQFTKKSPLTSSGYKKRVKAPKKGCPFEDPERSGHQIILTYPNEKNWKVMSVGNKFPAVSRAIGKKEIIEKSGPYMTMKARGFHEIVITKDHYKNFAHLDKASALGVFKVFQIRYKIAAASKKIKYFFAFHNWGSKAGASIFHPHYQIIALPIVSPDIHRSLEDSKRYFKKHEKCVHCEIIKFEKANKSRVIFENKEAIAFAPFASKEPFELKIFPKKHSAYFEDTSDAVMKGVAGILQKILLKMEENLGDPDYNFYIHTAPLKNKNSYKHYHWHVEVEPKFQVSAGVEVGTGIEITNVDPDEAAKILRK